MTEPVSCWILSDGRRGIENQALGLAEAAQRIRPINIATKILTPKGAFKMAQPGAQFSLKSDPEKYGLNSPFPNLVIGSGRQAIAPLRALKKRCGDEVFTVFVQSPRVSTKHFDMVIAPEHDRLTGENVFSTIGSTNRVTNEKLIIDTLKFGDQLARLPSPRVAMLIGGNSKTHKLDSISHDKHIQAAHTILGQKMSLLITTSRRTPDFAVEAYQKLASKNQDVWMWDGVDSNPYFAFLGSADSILVTEDSTNMLTEACATGKPVFSLPMKGKPGKFADLYESLKNRCNLAPFTGVFDAPDYKALDETNRAAHELWKRHDERAILSHNH